MKAEGPGRARAPTSQCSGFACTVPIWNQNSVHKPKKQRLLTRFALSEQQKPDDAFLPSRGLFCLDARIDGLANALCLCLFLQPSQALLGRLVWRRSKQHVKRIVGGNGHSDERQGKRGLILGFFLRHQLYIPQLNWVGVPESQGTIMMVRSHLFPPVIAVAVSYRANPVLLPGHLTLAQRT